MVERDGSGEWDDLETRSLMAAANLQTKQRQQYRSRQLVILILMALCAAMTFFREDIAAMFLLKDEQKDEIQSKSHVHKGEQKTETKEYFSGRDYYDDEDDDGKDINDDEDDETSSQDYHDNASQEDDDSEGAMDVSSQESKDENDASSLESLESIPEAQIEDLQQALSTAREIFDSVLKEQYGEYTSSIYDKNRLMKSVFPSESSISLERFKRRLKIKILQSQLSPGVETTYTWVVGGHSASAGHGNLFHQSYGAVLERLASPVFESLGITFYGKNFGMGGTSSAPELTMCMNAIFGMDMDVLSWDYGMTDGRNPHFYHMWTERAASHPTNPILFTYGGRYANDAYPNMEKTGRGGFHMNINEARDLIPDTETVDLDQLYKYPPGVRYFKCNGHVESGSPCSENEFKFNTTGYCDSLPGQVSWHNGFKDHFLMGSLMASFVVENLMEAMIEMTSPSQEEKEGRWLRKRRVDEIVGDESDLSQDAEQGGIAVSSAMTKEYLDYLLDLENRDKSAFFASSPTSVIGPLGENVGADIYKYFLRSNAICHTARLPAESRYDGLVTESGIISPYVHGGRRSYIEEGFEEGKLPEPISNDDDKSPLLMYNIRDSRKVCEYGKIDSKDAFVVRFADQWTTTLLPNDSEKEAFTCGDTSSEESEGIIMLCTVRFDWGNNPKKFVSIASMVVNATSSDGIIVNDVKATGYVGAGDDDCSVLKNDNGFFFPASPSGQYIIKLRVPSQYEDGTLYLSALVVVPQETKEDLGGKDYDDGGNVKDSNNEGARE